jgi:hypothetical protein
MMKADCYSEDFVCTSPDSMPFEQRKAVVRNRTTGRLAVIDMRNNVLIDVTTPPDDLRKLLFNAD